VNIADLKQLREIIIDGMEKDVSIKFSDIDIDYIVDDEKYVSTIITLLQSILNSRFLENRGKQKIRVYKDRINFACPICGDSMKNNYKKRGNFILTGKYKGFFKCHNCGSSMRIDRFFRDFKVTLDLGVINYIAKGIDDFASHVTTKYDMSLFLDMGSIEKYAIDRQEFLQYFHLEEIKDSLVWSWLKNRMQYDSQKFMYNARLNHIIILNLTQSGKILGIQKRTFKGSNKYLTYTLQKIYQLMNKNPKEIPDEINILSQIFNICLIDYSKSITLFEGPFDSFLFNNSIANAGAHKGFQLDLPVRYWYDDDHDGKNESIKKLNNEETVFLWEKFKRDFELPYRDKWDLNDVMIWFRDHNMKIPNFNNYFSNDRLDIIDI
jgi:hypothetical protein